MTVLATENFAGAAGALPANYTQQSTGPTVNRNGSGECTTSGPDTSQEISCYRNDVTWPNNQYCKHIIKALPGPSAFFTYTNNVLRSTGAGGTRTYYEGYADGFGGSGSCAIAKVINVLGTELGSTATAFAVNDEQYMSAVGFGAGGVILLKKNGSTLVTINNDGAIASGSAGLGFYHDNGAAAAPRLDDWEGGDFAAGSVGRPFLPGLFSPRFLTPRRRIL